MSTERARFGMIHGRFQPFHNGHREYMQLSLARCETLIVGITNPDPGQILEEQTSAHRHLAESNPFTFFERLRMIRESIVDDGIALDRVLIVPFPVNHPERWKYYVPRDHTHFVRVFSDWEQAKVDRLRAAGYRCEVLQPGAPKEIEATEIRRRMSAGERWHDLVPPGVARVIDQLQRDQG